MKKLILILLIFVAFDLSAQQKPIKGFYCLLNVDSVAITNQLCYYSVNIADAKRPFYVEIDTNMTFMTGKMTWDQSGRIKVVYRIFLSYWHFNHYYPQLYSTTQSFEISYDDFDIQSGGTYNGLEQYLPAKIKTGLSESLNIPVNKITIGSGW